MKPITNYLDPIHGAVSETAKAMSALNMEPDPITPKPGADGSDLYLSAVDGWAKHAMEHLHAVIDLLGAAHRRDANQMRLLHQIHVAFAGQTFPDDHPIQALRTYLDTYYADR